MRTISRFFFKIKWYKLSKLFSKKEYYKLMLDKTGKSLTALADAFQKLVEVAEQEAAKKGGIEEEREEDTTAQGEE